MEGNLERDPSSSPTSVMGSSDEGVEGETEQSLRCQGHGVGGEEPILGGSRRWDFTRTEAPSPQHILGCLWTVPQIQGGKDQEFQDGTPGALNPSCRASLSGGPRVTVLVACP